MSKKPIKNRDFWILGGVGAVLVCAFIAITFRLIDQEDTHVREVEQTRIAEGFSTDEIVQDEAAISVDRTIKENPNAVEADFSTLNVTDRLLKKICTMRRLERLNLSHSSITDKATKYLVGLPLKELDISGTAITDEGVKQLVKIESLMRIDFTEDAITDESLALLAKLPHIDNLVLVRTKTSDRGLIPLSDSPTLNRLDVGNTAITDASLPYLSKLRLIVLSLSTTAVTARGISTKLKNRSLKKFSIAGCKFDDNDAVKLSLANLPGVHTFDVSSTRITDAGLLSLAKLTQLSLLKIKRCDAITQEGIAAFKQKNPKTTLQDLSR